MIAEKPKLFCSLFSFLFVSFPFHTEMSGCCRVLQICDLVRDCVGQPDADCSITPAPPDSCAEDSTSTILKRCACKDAKPAASLRKIMSHRKSSNSVQSDLSSWQGSQSEEYGGLEDVQVRTNQLPMLRQRSSPVILKRDHNAMTASYRTNRLAVLRQTSSL